MSVLLCIVCTHCELDLKKEVHNQNHNIPNIAYFDFAALCCVFVCCIPGSHSFISYISSSHIAGVNRLSCQLKGPVAGWKPVGSNTCSKLCMQMYFLSLKFCPCLLFVVRLLCTVLFSVSDTFWNLKYHFEHLWQKKIRFVLACMSFVNYVFP